MKAWELQGGFGIESLALAERPLPALVDGTVKIKLKAWSLNYRDLMIVRGTYNPKLRMPMTPLSDGAGEVVEIGAGVTRVRVGQRVAAIFMQEWLDGELTEAKSRSALGGGRQGMLSEYVVLSQDGVVPVPEHLSFEEAATLPCAAVTAWHAVATAGNVPRDSTVLIQGPGGVSLFAMQFALLRGARVIATSSSDAKLTRLSSLGVSDGINYVTTPQWPDRVRELTGGTGADHIVEVGGAGTLGLSLQAVRMGGRISLIGVLAGAGQINPLPILMKGVCVQGIYVGSRAMFLTMNEAITRHRLHPIVDRVFPMAEFPNALRYLESGAHFGKVVVKAA
jgi:NADPH:quinone reductase-like Zn-dependent oxidoreductase